MQAQPTKMPPHRRRAFAEAVAQRLEQVGPEAPVQAIAIAQMQAEQRALAQALQDAEFARAMDAAFIHEMARQQQNADYVPQPDAVARDMGGIRTRRAADALAFAALLDNPAFIAELRALPHTPQAHAYQLPLAKQEETIRRLVQEGDPDGAEPSIHVAASAMGQRLLHQALANMFATDGLLRAPLEEALARAMPQAHAAQLAAVAASWLQARQNPARATAEGLKPGGAFYEEAMRRALHPRSPLRTALLATPVLTPAQREATKTRQEKAEDVMYTLNHAITCLSLTDLLVAPAVGALSATWFGTQAHDAGHGHSHGHDHGQGAQPFMKRMGHWVIGEFVGDMGAVPVTVAVQRFAPGLMGFIRTLTEPLVGWAFKAGVQRASTRWASEHALAPQSPQAIAHAHHLYEYEMQHLPQMVVWTAASVGLNFATMKAMDRNMQLGGFIKGKALGAGITAGLVFGARALAPALAHRWDATAGKAVVVPVSKKVGQLFGVSDAEAEQFQRRGEAGTPRWVQRVGEASTAMPGISLVR